MGAQFGLPFVPQVSSKLFEVALSSAEMNERNEMSRHDSDVLLFVMEVVVGNTTLTLTQWTDLMKNPWRYLQQSTART